jgi:hypothetical protein
MRAALVTLKSKKPKTNRDWKYIAKNKLSETRNNKTKGKRNNTKGKQKGELESLLREI